LRRRGARALWLTVAVVAARGAGAAIPGGTPVHCSTAEAMALLAQVHPEGAIISTTLLGDGPTAALHLPGEALIVPEAFATAHLTGAATGELLASYLIFREVTGFWLDRQFGVAVFRGGRLVWFTESEPAFMFHGMPFDLVTLHRGGPTAIRLSYAFTPDVAAPRTTQRRERLVAWRDGQFQSILDETTVADGWGRAIEVLYGCGASDASGWSVITKSAVETGSTRTCSLVFDGDRYLEQMCNAFADHPDLQPLAVQGPVTLDGPELSFSVNADPGLPLLMTLDTVDAVIEQPGHWRGPTTRQVRLYGGVATARGDLVLHFRVTSPGPSAVPWADRCEVWLWDGTEGRLSAWEAAPGDGLHRAAAVRQTLPALLDRPAGVHIAARWRDDGYSLVVNLDAARLHLDLAAPGRYRCALLTRFGAGPGNRDDACAMATSRTFAPGNPQSLNPLVYHPADPLEIAHGWFDATIVSATRDGLHVVAREADVRALPLTDLDLALTITPASQLRTLHGTALALSAMAPGDRAEIGYHYDRDVPIVDWLRPHEKTVEGVVTSVDPGTARVGFRDLDGTLRHVVVPPTAGKESYDHLALADLDAVHPGDRVSFWYVGDLAAAVVERIGIRPPAGGRPAVTVPRWAAMPPAEPRP